MTTTCSFCQRRGHNIVSCKRYAKIMDRIMSQVEEQLLAEFKWDVVRQTRRQVERLQAEVEWLKLENEILAREVTHLWEHH